jgi:hypothetical protein
VTVALTRCAATLLVTLLAASASPQGADPIGAPDWQKDTRPWREQARQVGLTDVEISRLERDSLVVAGPELQQSFEPYIGSPLPVFVTSDAVLNAFHVLLEESLKGLEHAHARRLRALVHLLRDGLDSPPFSIEGRAELGRASIRRARLVLGVALALFGDPPRTSAEEAELVRAEVARVVDARAMFKPAWLGPPDDGFLAIDYSRFRPRSFYAGDPVLERAFRAREWLQSIPFRPDRDEELATFALIQEIAHRLPFAASRVDGTEQLLGSPADLAAITFNNGTNLDGPTSLEYLRRRYRDERPRRSVPDQVRVKSGERTLRLLSAHSTADGALFARNPDRPDLPSGLEIAAALGSSVAAEALPDGAQILGALRRGVVSPGESLYDRYLETLGTLLDPPDPDAPALFAGRAWQVKSCGAALASWAQMRHALVSHVREHGVIGGIVFTPAGFVEPSPVFFGRLATLAEHMHESLAESGAFGEEPTVAAAAIRSSIGTLRWALAQRGKESEFTRSLALGDLASQLFDAGETVLGSSPGALITQAERTIDRLQRLSPQEARESLALRHLWYKLSLLCRRLEALSQAQLRHRPLSADDESFLRDVGAELAHVMLYTANTYEAPRHDEPRIVDIATDPGRGLHREVGVARPRTLYLLYPHDGRDVLTQGAVLPYREFNSRERLTDAEWSALLDRGGPEPGLCSAEIEMPPRPRPKD